MDLLPKAFEPQKHVSYTFVYSFSAILLSLGFVFDSPQKIFEGLIAIYLSPGNLITDYMAVGGVGAAFVNAGLTTLTSIILVHHQKIRITGPVFAGIFTVAGFSFFGKNIVNSIPIMLGCVLYARYTGLQVRNVILSALFGTSLAPMVSFIAFGLGLPLPFSIPLAFVSGLLVGFVMSPLASHFLSFHQGFNLYNIGFTAGILGMAVVGVLRMFGVEVQTSQLVYSGDDSLFWILAAGFNLFLILFGYFKNGRTFRGYRSLLAESGRLVSDFVAQFGEGLVSINMGVLGFVCLIYIKAAGGMINGATLGGYFTVLGFAAFGKHLRNVLPVVAGIFLANLVNIHPADSTGSILMGLFGTCLAPVAGYCGWPFGFLAGFIHAAMVNNVAFLHGGLNLYNNGFSGGFVAAVLVPVFDIFLKRKERPQG